MEQENGFILVSPDVSSALLIGCLNSLQSSLLSSAVNASAPLQCRATCFAKNMQYSLYSIASRGQCVCVTGDAYSTLYLQSSPCAGASGTAWAFYLSTNTPLQAASPVVRLSLASDMDYAGTNATLLFQVSQLLVYQVNVSFGDGTLVRLNQDATSVTHVWSAPGSYTVLATMSSGSSSNVSSALQVLVLAVPTLVSPLEQVTASANLTTNRSAADLTVIALGGSAPRVCTVNGAGGQKLNTTLELSLYSKFDLLVAYKGPGLYAFGMNCSNAASVNKSAAAALVVTPDGAATNQLALSLTYSPPSSGADTVDTGLALVAVGAASSDLLASILAVDTASNRSLSTSAVNATGGSSLAVTVLVSPLTLDYSLALSYQALLVSLVSVSYQPASSVMLANFNLSVPSAGALLVGTAYTFGVQLPAFQANQTLSVSFGDGASQVLAVPRPSSSSSSGAAINVAHTYNAAGTFTLAATLSIKGVQVNRSLSVLAATRIAGAALQVSDCSRVLWTPCVDVLVSLAATQQAATVVINWGDTTAEQQYSIVASDHLAVSYTFASYGVYNVQASISNALSTTSVSQSVLVGAPVAGLSVTPVIEQTSVGSSPALVHVALSSGSGIALALTFNSSASAAAGTVTLRNVYASANATGFPANVSFSLSSPALSGLLTIMQNGSMYLSLAAQSSGLYALSVLAANTLGSASASLPLPLAVGAATLASCPLTLSVKAANKLNSLAGSSVAVTSSVSSGGALSIGWAETLQLVLALTSGNSFCMLAPSVPLYLAFRVYSSGSGAASGTPLLSGNYSAASLASQMFTLGFTALPYGTYTLQLLGVALVPFAAFSIPFTVIVAPTSPVAQLAPAAVTLLNSQSLLLDLSSSGFADAAYPFAGAGATPSVPSFTLLCTTSPISAPTASAVAAAVTALGGSPSVSFTYAPSVGSGSVALYSAACLPAGAPTPAYSGAAGTITIPAAQLAKSASLSTYFFYLLVSASSPEGGGTLTSAVAQATVNVLVDNSAALINQLDSNATGIVLLAVSALTNQLSQVSSQVRVNEPFGETPNNCLLFQEHYFNSNNKNK